MKITQEADYAIRILLYLSINFNDCVSKVEAVTVSGNTGVPLRFTLKIMRKLSYAGFLKSYRGNKGGYSLLKEPQNISVLDVIETIDGSVNINKCLGDKSSCNINSNKYCAVHEHLKLIQNKITEELSSLTFDKLMHSQLNFDK